MISLVIPVYNYQDKLPETLERLREWIKTRKDVLEVLFVDDGSTDGTATILKEVKQPMRVLTLTENLGKGGAVRAGVFAAEGDQVFFTDIDLPYDFRAIDDAVQKFTQGADMVSGSRYLADSAFAVKRSRKREFSSIVFGFLANTILLAPVADTQCGIKGFRRDVARQIFTDLIYTGYIFDVELFYHAQHRRLSVEYVPVRLVNESTSSVHIMRDGFKMAFDLLRLYARTRTSITRRDVYFIGGLGFAMAVLLIPTLHNIGILEMLARIGLPPMLTIVLLLTLLPFCMVIGALALTLLPFHKHSAAQFSRYAVVGAYNTALNAAIFNSLIYVSGTSEGLLVTLFALITFAVVITQAFFWNIFWTFHNAPRDNRRRQYMKFFAVTSTTALVNLGIIHILVNVVGAPEGISSALWANCALLFTIFTAILGNFLGYKFFVFADRK